jgi:transcriptional regulator of acetoin/glycerol metabolism
LAQQKSDKKSAQMQEKINQARGYWTDEEEAAISIQGDRQIFREDHQYYATLQTPTRRRKNQQQEDQQKLRRSSFGEQLMPRLLDREQYENLRRTLDEVQRDLDNALVHNLKWEIFETIDSCNLLLVHISLILKIGK